MRPIRLRRRADGGSIALFVAICAAALVILVGIVLEGGGRLRAIENADARAQEAARAVGQQLDRAALLSGRGYVLKQDLDEARGVAAAYLEPYGLQPAEISFRGDRTVVVEIRTTYRTTLLGAMRVEELDVHGLGSAGLVHGVRQAENP
ncbi:hypothetical protein ACIA8O_15190 [Kitasatospora sp. NPDC051853]|uniref:hypothetical protein n=1 Tax=Kitasatospora sp. NPDC051853 TaxID=3364058 RepID=UPI0037956962